MRKPQTVEEAAIAFGDKHPNPCFLTNADTEKLIEHERAVAALIIYNALGMRAPRDWTPWLNVSRKVWDQVVKELDTL